MFLTTLLLVMLAIGVLGGIVAGINMESIDCPVKGGMLGAATVGTVIVLTAFISLSLPRTSQASDIEEGEPSPTIEIPVVQQFVIHEGSTP